MKKIKIKGEKHCRKFILSLIKDDLTNTKLINGLLDLRINADEYSLHLAETIFQLMGFEEHSLENDPIFDQYFQLSERVRFIDTRNAEHLNKLAEDLYAYLEMQKT